MIVMGVAVSEDTQRRLAHTGPTPRLCLIGQNGPSPHCIAMGVS